MSEGLRAGLSPPGHSIPFFVCEPRGSVTGSEEETPRPVATPQTQERAGLAREPLGSVCDGPDKKQGGGRLPPLKEVFKNWNQRAESTSKLWLK